MSSSSDKCPFVLCIFALIDSAAVTVDITVVTVDFSTVTVDSSLVTVDFYEFTVDYGVVKQFEANFFTMLLLKKCFMSYIFSFSWCIFH
ncbi:hypothetical protein GCM10007968_23940 [Sporolactobacillus putidus]|uniref:Uncharacterized protein n=1 Tax=Sporolactobacillus putidus TaxID=492735 RepID=A0A917W1V2_9BACL|nr:hypothetical protein GCM10007968_23940 [Sporolactobacillus putidus]